MTAGAKSDRRASREERLRAALRDNLKRRKAQARGREFSPAAVEETSAGEGGAPRNRDGENLD